MRRWLRPPRRLRPTRAGWCFFAIVLGVGFAAMNTGNNLLYLVQSLLLAFLVLSGLLSEAALRGIEVRRRLPRSAHAGGDASVWLDVTNAQRRFPAFAVVVEDVWARARKPESGPTAGRVFALRIDPGTRERRRYRLQAERRGSAQWAGVRVSTRFPFGLFSKERWIDLPGELLVYPALAAAPARTPSTAATSAGGHAGPAAAGGALAGALREFRPGDALRRVHWPTAVRRAGLFVRETEEEALPRAVVRLRTRGARAGAPFEADVSRAASEVVTFLEQGRSVGLATDSRTEEAGHGEAHRARLLSLLARVEPDAATPSGASAAPVAERGAAA